MDNATQRLAAFIRANGPISTIRISAAKQNACKWSYWDAVRYQIRLTRGGEPANIALEAASRSRRSAAGAEPDMGCNMPPPMSGHWQIDRGASRSRAAIADLT